MSIKTIEQERAEFALQKIDEVDNRQKDYGSLARGLPAMLQVNGLGNTLAFLKAKSGNQSVDQSHHARLYYHMASWLHKKIRKAFEPETGESADSFINWLMQNDSSIYRQSGVEAMAFAIWLRRFAEGKGWSEQSPTGEQQDATPG